MSTHSIVEISADLWAKICEMVEARDVMPEDIIRVGIAGLSGSFVLYALTDKIGFGKYANETVDTIIRCDPRYVVWLVENTERFRLGRAAQELLNAVVGSVQ